MSTRTDAVIFAFPRDYLTRADKDLLAQWQARARSHGIARIEIEERDRDGAFVSPVISVFRYENDWASWRIVRNAGACTVWRKLGDAIIGTVGTLQQALEVVCPSVTLDGLVAKAGHDTAIARLPDRLKAV